MNEVEAAVPRLPLAETRERDRADLSPSSSSVSTRSSPSSPPPAAAAVRLHHQNDIYKIEIENGHHMNVFMPSSQIILESTEAASTRA